MFDLLYSIFFMVYLIKETHYKGSRKKSIFFKDLATKREGGKKNKI